MLLVVSVYRELGMKGLHLVAMECRPLPRDFADCLEGGVLLVERFDTW